jgi:cytochrome P450
VPQRRFTDVALEALLQAAHADPAVRREVRDCHRPVGVLVQILNGSGDHRRSARLSRLVQQATIGMPGPGAMNEVLRLEAPIQSFSRYTTTDHDLEGVRIPAGSRAIMFYGAAGRDEREYPDPDRFDVRRSPANHLAFGTGPHVCVGVYLARLEMTALFTALARRVRRFELGTAERALHNILRGFTRLDVTVSPA